MKQKSLSASKLKGFIDCPRCFYLSEKLGLGYPRGIFPSLPSGFDKIIKEWSDIIRVSPKPVYDIGNDDLLQAGCLYAGVDPWRNWRTGLTFNEQGYKIIGALDDCLVTENGVYTPLDFKTKGSEPKTDTEAETYYGFQCSMYSLLIEKNDYKPSGQAWIVYFFPELIKKDCCVLNVFSTRMRVKPFKVNADPKLAMAVIKDAIVLLEQNTIPDYTSGCDYCDFIQAVKNIDGKSPAQQNFLNGLDK